MRSGLGGVRALSQLPVAAKGAIQQAALRPCRLAWSRCAVVGSAVAVGNAACGGRRLLLRGRAHGLQWCAVAAEDGEGAEVALEPAVAGCGACLLNALRRLLAGRGRHRLLRLRRSAWVCLHLLAGSRGGRLRRYPAVRNRRLRSASGRHGVVAAEDVLQRAAPKPAAGLLRRHWLNRAARILRRYACRRLLAGRRKGLRHRRRLRCRRAPLRLRCSRIATAKDVSLQPGAGRGRGMQRLAANGRRLLDAARWLLLRKWQRCSTAAGLALRIAARVGSVQRLQLLVIWQKRSSVPLLLRRLRLLLPWHSWLLHSALVACRLLRRAQRLQRLQR